MKQPICWTDRCEDGVKRDVRVEVGSHSIKWQFRRKGETVWDCEQQPDEDDWETLEDVLERRAARGRSLNMQKIVRKWRQFLADNPGTVEPPPGFHR